MSLSSSTVQPSGIAGMMAANGSELQLATIRNMLMAWVLTLPVAILLWVRWISRQKHRDPLRTHPLAATQQSCKKKNACINMQAFSQLVVEVEEAACAPRLTPPARSPPA
jgi:hypothetical protein